MLYTSPIDLHINVEQRGDKLQSKKSLHIVNVAGKAPQQPSKYQNKLYITIKLVEDADDLGKGLEINESEMITQV